MAATNSALGARGGLCPRAAIPCGRIVQRPPPGSGYPLWKGSKDMPSHESLSLGLEQTVW